MMKFLICFLLLIYFVIKIQECSYVNHFAVIWEWGTHYYLLKKIVEYEYWSFFHRYCRQPTALLASDCELTSSEIKAGEGILPFLREFNGKSGLLLVCWGCCFAYWVCMLLQGYSIQDTSSVQTLSTVLLHITECPWQWTLLQWPEKSINVSPLFHM